MKKLVMLVCALTLFAALAMAADPAPAPSAPDQAPAAAPATTTGSETAPAAGKAVPIANRPCSSLNLDTPEGLKAAGFIVDTQPISDGGIPNCPAISGSCTSGTNVTCEATGCSLSNTGLDKCRRPNGQILDCGGEGTIQVVTCTGCFKESENACCSQNPPCACATCINGTNQSLTCQ